MHLHLQILDVLAYSLLPHLYSSAHDSPKRNYIAATDHNAPLGARLRSAILFTCGFVIV